MPIEILQNYNLGNILRTENLGSAGGFSGARLWKIDTSEDAFCLRRWPPAHPDHDRLDWIHRVLRHTVHNDCPFVAAPLLNRSDESFVRHDGHFWEVSRWMPGTANFLDDANDERLKNMMRVLARFHRASAQVHLNFGLSPGVQSRMGELREVSGLLGKLSWDPTSKAIVPDAVVTELDPLRSLVLSEGRRLAQTLLSRLAEFENAVWPIQPVIRDVWHDHVLFTGNEVSGLVDFGAMQIDSIAFDIARLLGSTLPDDDARWSTAYEFYGATHVSSENHSVFSSSEREPTIPGRSLAQNEIALISLLDQSGILLGSLNWLKWICLDGRQFENPEYVAKRIRFLRQRLFGLVVCG